MRILAKTKHFEIQERSHNNNFYYVVMADNKNWNKFYNKYDAFSFCYKEIEKRAKHEILQSIF